MPRTFKRGKRFTAADLFDLNDNYLIASERSIFQNEAIFRFCREEGLIEQSPLDLLDFLDKFKLLEQLIQSFLSFFERLVFKESFPGVRRRLGEALTIIGDTIADVERGLV